MRRGEASFPHRQQTSTRGRVLIPLPPGRGWWIYATLAWAETACVLGFRSWRRHEAHRHARQL